MREYSYFDYVQKVERERNAQKREAVKRLVYGKHEGHWQWDLAVSWFQMSNDGFFNLYGFNFVPKGRLFTEARDFVNNK